MNRRTFLRQSSLAGSAGTLAILAHPVSAEDQEAHRAARADRLELSDFAEQLGSRFVLRGDADRALLAELVQAEPLAWPGDGPARQRAPFSLRFRVLRQARLEQATYQVRHRVLGRMQLFLVPTGSAETSEELLAVFS